MIATYSKNKTFIAAILMSLSFALVVIPQFTQAQTLTELPRCTEEQKIFYQNEIARLQKALNEISKVTGSGWQKIDQNAISAETLALLKERNEELKEEFGVDEYLGERSVIYRFTQTGGYGGVVFETQEEIHVEKAKSELGSMLVAQKTSLKKCIQEEDEDIINNPTSTPEEISAAQERIQGRQEDLAGDIDEAMAATMADPGSVQSHKLDDSKCFYRWGINPMICLLNIAAAVATIILKLFGVLLWLASSIFDLSIYISIISFKSLIASPGVDAAWRIMRDLANLSFIFILFYIAISVIFDISVGSNGKKLIVDVIIIALLVNFSGFLVRVVVDASNVVAYEFYSRMSYDPQANDGWVLDKVNANIGTALVSKLGLMNHVVPVENADDPNEVTITRLGYLQIVIGALGGILIILMASFVLLVASIMFILRTVTLLFVYVFSPVGLTLRLIPMFKNSHKLWLDTLIKQSFYAPAFLIPLFAVFKILGTQGLSTLAQDAGIGTGLLKITSIQIIVMALIVSCIFIAQKFGAFGLKFSKEWGGKGVSLLSKSTFGTTKLLGRGALGASSRAGGYLASTSAGQAISRGVSLTASNIANTRVARGATSAARWTANTAAAQAVGSSVSGIARNVKDAVKDKVEHPLLYASDVISAGASKIGGVDGFNIMGATREERNKAKEEGKKKKEEERNSETNRLLRESLTSAASFADVQSIVSGIARDALKIIDLKVFADIPQAACALSHDQVIRLTNREGKGSDDSKHKSKIRTNILAGGTTPFAFSADPAVYSYMDTGAGRVFWR
ncbi:MAG TPA: hypothetical protein PKN73_00720 [Candidatus Paceibacterota bacterium]|nr:hypothetical protein [Candidatus Paceibacterota bacterium]HOH11184.1 hypothetical protein [Candidatus Paceibacterota bacterium]HPY12881.1 hypothetical protein [Candidatus Paceibacterota bacterium]HQB26891.1 hypothetical protein [Candidatus Paceibacterota bacterium]